MICVLMRGCNTRGVVPAMEVLMRGCNTRGVVPAMEVFVSSCSLQLYVFGGQNLEEEFNDIWSTAVQGNEVGELTQQLYYVILQSHLWSTLTQRQYPESATLHPHPSLYHAKSSFQLHPQHQNLETWMKYVPTTLKKLMNCLTLSQNDFSTLTCMYVILKLFTVTMSYLIQGQCNFRIREGCF